MTANPTLSATKFALLWAVILIELVLPVPGALTISAALVLLYRPAWFRTLVRQLYGES